MIRKIFVSIFLVFSLNFLAAQTSGDDFFWDLPSELGSTNSYFPTSLYDGEDSYIFFEEVNEAKKEISISMIRNFNKNQKTRISKTLKYSGSEVPDIYSAAISKNGIIAVSVVNINNATEKGKIYTSTDGGKSFTDVIFPDLEMYQILSTRIFSDNSGGFKIFASVGNEGGSLNGSTFSMMFSESQDGLSWRKFSQFKPVFDDKEIVNIFSPFYTQIEGNEIVVFSGEYEGDKNSSMLYSSVRNSDGNWNKAVIVSDEKTDFADKGFLEYRNYRPFVFSDGKNSKIAWERTSLDSNKATVIVSPFGSDGKVKDTIYLSALNDFGNARRPNIFKFKGTTYTTWFDEERVHLVFFENSQWEESKTLSERMKKVPRGAFSCPAVYKLKNGTQTLSLVFQRPAGFANRLYTIDEDYSAVPPKINAKNFTIGRRGKNYAPRVQIVPSADVSGIQGVSALWTFEKEKEPPADVKSEFFTAAVNNVVLTAKIPENEEKDSIVYFKARVLDKAGNWSETASVEYYFDRTPPKKPAEIFFQKDKWGFALSNDLEISWKPDETDDDVGGYSWTLTKISGIDRKFTVSRARPLTASVQQIQNEFSRLLRTYPDYEKLAKKPSVKFESSKQSARYKNRENGFYVFSVRAFDNVGNYSEPLQQIVFMNKYKAATVIKNVSMTVDDFGNVELEIFGTEFSYDGVISEVIVSGVDNGAEYVFRKSDDDYKIIRFPNSDDEKITGLKLDFMKAGKYSVKVRHSERGLAVWNKNLVKEESGTVKYEKRYNYEPVWSFIPAKEVKFILSSELIENTLFAGIILLILIGIAALFRMLVVTVKESLKIKNDIILILEGGSMAEKNNISKVAAGQIQSKLKQRSSLKVKMAWVITLLLLFIVAGVAFAIGYSMSKNQERLLIAQMKGRVQSVMGIVSSGSRRNIEEGEYSTLRQYVNVSENFSDAEYLTIISHELDTTNFDDIYYVWSTSDPVLLKDDSLNYGKTRLGNIPYEIRENLININSEAKNILDNIEYDYKRNGIKNESIDDYAANKLNDYAAKIFNEKCFYPYFSSDSLNKTNSEFVFYWPVLFKSIEDRDGNFPLQGVILMKIHTDSLIESVDKSAQLIMTLSLVAAGIALVIGIVFAIILASVIVNPIKKVVSHVRKITETTDKEELDGFELKIKSHDELRTLGDSVNEMTKGLVKGAKDEKRVKIETEKAAKAREDAAKAQAEEAKAREEKALADAEKSKAQAENAMMNMMNMDGQAVQKAFIPLANHGTEKITTAKLDDAGIQIFGYYEGTDAVSGDYFDYKKLDDRWYAIIKCDVSGHGVPAALIMTIVATIFRRHFGSWSLKSDGTKLNLLISDINDFIESLGLRGKFAAMLICLFDSKSGEVYMCNAGDNIVHYFSAKEKKLKILKLQESPAAGPLPSFMVDLKGGYKVEKFKLNQDDILFLYTDGIEESTRFFRNSEFEVTKCVQSGLNDGDLHGNHKVGDISEQMEPVRVKEIIESVLNRQKYVLEKYHSPVQNESLEFDFTKCEGTIEEAIIALTAVEKVFRMYKKPGASGTVEKTEMKVDGKTKTLVRVVGDGIRIDRKTDAFLKKTFNLYDFYCKNIIDMDESNYVYYTNLNEDPQADDLTLLAVKKV